MYLDSDCSINDTRIISSCLQVILPALRSDIADLPLPDDIIPHMPPPRSNSNALRLYSSMNGLALDDAVAEATDESSAQPDALRASAPFQQVSSRPQTPEKEASAGMPIVDEDSSDWAADRYTDVSKQKGTISVASVLADCRLQGGYSDC